VALDGERSGEVVDQRLDERAEGEHGIVIGRHRRHDGRLPVPCALDRPPAEQASDLRTERWRDPGNEAGGAVQEHGCSPGRPDGDDELACPPAEVRKEVAAIDTAKLLGEGEHGGERPGAVRTPTHLDDRSHDGRIRVTVDGADDRQRFDRAGLHRPAGPPSGPRLGRLGHRPHGTPRRPAGSTLCWVATGGSRGGRRVEAVLRHGDRVTALELFFDLVFVLAITQCTAFMANDPTWRGIVRGTVVLGVLWWAWVGYAWLTSVVDPEEGVVRLAMFAAMAALLVVSLCVPEAFGDLGLTLAVAYGLVRAGQLTLFLIAGRDVPSLRHSVWIGLLPSTTLGVGLLVVASQVDGDARLALWIAALALDMLGPYLFGSEGWMLEPHHFAERHGLIFIIALGESIVAIGVGAEVGVDAGVITAAVLGTALAAAMWWAYFDVVALVAERRLSAATRGTEQNEIARDSYSFLHFPMVAGVVLMALGLKKTIATVDEPLQQETAFALVGGVAIYLLAHVAFRLRNIRTLNRQRLVVAIVLLASAPFADRPDALVTLSILTVVMCLLITYEAIRFADGRHVVRHATSAEPPS
jgi:low temperature requirement protein LtrA